MEKLEILSEKVMFNKFHYTLLSAEKMGLPINFIGRIKNRIMTLKF
jgi:hypothetical protein